MYNRPNNRPSPHSISAGRLWQCEYKRGLYLSLPLLNSHWYNRPAEIECGEGRLLGRLYNRPDGNTLRRGAVVLSSAEDTSSWRAVAPRAGEDTSSWQRGWQQLAARGSPGPSDDVAPRPWASKRGASVQAGTQLTCHSAGRLWQTRLFNVELRTPRGFFFFPPPTLKSRVCRNRHMLRVARWQVNCVRGGSLAPSQNSTFLG